MFKFMVKPYSGFIGTNNNVLVSMGNVLDTIQIIVKWEP